MPPIWRSGLYGANNYERSVIIDAENKALSRAYEDTILEAGSAPGVLIPHLPELHHRNVSTRWARHERRLWIWIRVYFGGGYPVREYRWRSAVRDPRGV